MIEISNDILLTVEDCLDIAELQLLWKRAKTPLFTDCLPKPTLLVDHVPMWPLSIIRAWLTAKGIWPVSQLMVHHGNLPSCAPVRDRKTLEQVSNELDLVNLCRLGFYGPFSEIVKRRCGTKFHADQVIAILPRPIISWWHLVRDPDLREASKVSLVYWLWRDILVWIEAN